SLASIVLCFATSDDDIRRGLAGWATDVEAIAAVAAGFQSFYEDSFGAEDVHSVPPLVARVVGAARNDNRAEPLYVDVLAKDVDELIILAESSRVANDHARLENQDRVAGDM